MKNILIVNSAEDSEKKFTDDIAHHLNQISCFYMITEYRGISETILKHADGIIISGSPQGNDIVEHHLPYFQWIRNYIKPVLGICAGHHISGALYGSELFRSQEPESGDFDVEVLNDDLLFSGMPRKFKVKQMHNDSISLPEGFTLLATSETCQNQLMKCNSKPLYTCQFHPEYYNHWLIKNFVELIVK